MTLPLFTHIVANAHWPAHWAKPFYYTTLAVILSGPDAPYRYNFSCS